MSKQKLVILPGWSGNQVLWQHQCQHLSDIVDVEVIVVTNQNTIAKMADEVVSCIPGKFILVGHSLGGLVAQHIAIHYPERVSKLILIATWTGAASPEFVEFLKQALQRIKQGETTALLAEILPSLVHPTRKSEAPLLELIKKGQSQFPQEGFINQTLAEIDSEDTTPFLHKIQCSTLVIHARQDAFFPLETLKKIKDRIPNAHMTIVEDCGHMLSVERPEAITALIRLWVQIE